MEELAKKNSLLEKISISIMNNNILNEIIKNSSEILDIKLNEIYYKINNINNIIEFLKTHSIFRIK